MDSIENGFNGGGAPSSNLSAYLKQHRHMTYIPNNITSSFDASDDHDDDDDRIGKHTHNPTYAISHQNEDSQRETLEQ
jgi:hypothetical protein